jgi:DNA-binding transcriptional LysR family regulator
VTDDPPVLRIAFVPGVTLRKWTRAWQERHPQIPLEVLPAEQGEVVADVLGGGLDLAFVRLPIDRESLSVVRLYGEVPMVVVPRDSDLAARDSLSAAEVAEIAGLVGSPPAGGVRDAVALVAAGVGAVALPHSLARLHARKDVVAIPITDAPETEIAVIWLADAPTPEIEEFVGIVRGRTAASSRNPSAPADPQPKRAASPARPTGQKAHRITGNRAQARNRKGRGR